MEVHFRAFGAAYPVALCFFEGVGPVDCVESVEESLGVGGHTQAPLFHDLLYDGVSASDGESFDYLVVGEYCAEFGAPVDHHVATVGDAVVHEGVLLLAFGHVVPIVGGEGQGFGLRGVDALGAVFGEEGGEYFYWACFVEFGVVE